MQLKQIKRGLLYRLRMFEEYYFGKNIIRKSERASPDFLIIGAAKAGTTSLFQYLANHPEIIPPQEKELKFFAMSNRIKGLKWYLNNFPFKADKHKKLTFEATPTYLFIKNSPKAIARLYPQIKLIAILREPVSRAFSHWNFYQPYSKVRNKTLIDKRSFKEAVYQEIKDPKSIPWIHQYLSRGLYAAQLREWYKYFKEDQLLLLDFEEFKNNTHKCLEEVAIFLNIGNIYSAFKKTDEKVVGLLGTRDKQNQQELKAYNASNYLEQLDEGLETQLKEYFIKSNKELQELTGKKFSWLE